MSPHTCRTTNHGAGWEADDTGTDDGNGSPGACRELEESSTDVRKAVSKVPAWGAPPGARPPLQSVARVDRTGEQLVSD
ncbi:hypothetical protein STXM2123_2698 [Streptomyces sp. F-3]|uniref:Uncharacterized protein n=1 Tax=Streptomyces thermogriseus TaxID=75292 RepID=A0ABN1T213_9ACTN|nr:hypothetical protein STXM2123_2698 [Streptomyces sp. F-3]